MGKNVQVGKGMSGIRIRCSCSDEIGGKAPPLREKVKIAVERREKMRCCVTRGDKCDGVVVVGVTLEVRLHSFKKLYNCDRKTGKNVGVCKARRGT